MSRHFYKCELRCEVVVVLSCENPAQGYVLEVSRVGLPGQGYSTFLYDSAQDPYHTGDNLDYCRETLEKLGLDVPESIFRAVEEDVARAHRCAEHFADGRIIEQ
jgi:hypothetical protein